VSSCCKFRNLWNDESPYVILATAKACANSHQEAQPMSEDQIELFPGLKPPMNEETQRLNLLALARVRGIGEASLKVFLDAYTDLQRVWEISPAELRLVSSENGLKLTDAVFKDIRANRAKLEEGAKLDLESLNRQGIQLLTDLNDAFP